MREVDVLVVGAGTVGLASALFLARQGVRALVVERHPGPARHPRAFAVNGRSAELFREVGVEGRLADLSAALRAPFGVVRILVADLVTEGHLRIDEPLTDFTPDLIERIRDRVRAL